MLNIYGYVNIYCALILFVNTVMMNNINKYIKKILLTIVSSISYDLLSVNFINMTKNNLIYIYISDLDMSMFSSRSNKAVLKIFSFNKSREFNLIKELIDSNDFGLNIYVTVDETMNKPIFCGNIGFNKSISKENINNLADIKNRAATILVKEENDSIICTLSFD